MTEDDLLFDEIRQFTPQWNVRLADGTLVARVTERVIAQPAYAVTRIEGGEDKGDVFLIDREAVMTKIIAWCSENEATG